VRVPLFLQAAFETSRSSAIGCWYIEVLIRAKRYEEAFEGCAWPELRDYSTSLYLQLESAAFEDGQYRLSARAGEIAFNREPRPDVAYNVGCALARCSELEEAIKWVKTALDTGFTDWELLSTDPDLAVLREHEGFPNAKTGAPTS